MFFCFGNRVQNNEYYSEDNWKTGLLECSNLNVCIVSFLAPCYANALAKHYMDDSSSCFNLLCFNHIATRSLIREKHNIQGNIFEDFCKGYFCYCCSINQVNINSNDIKRRQFYYIFIVVADCIHL